jgi:chemotaxis family two-component system response regulator PixG
VNRIILVEEYPIIVINTQAIKPDYRTYECICHRTQEDRMLTTESTRIESMVQKLNTLCQKMVTGDLVFDTHAKEGRLHFSQGRLLYATSDFHRVRRWHRAIKKNCPNWIIQPTALTPKPDQPWEYQLLQQGLATEKLTLAQAKTVIDYVTLEVLFSLFDSVNYTTETLLRVSQPEQTSSLEDASLGLSYTEIEPLLTKVSQLHFQWETAGLNSFNPTLAPVLKQSINSKALSGWDKYLNGQFTLWDISLRLGKSITAVTRALLPLIKKGLVQLRMVPDLPDPLLPYPPTESKSDSDNKPVAKLPAAFKPQVLSGDFKRPLIACIDDSPVVAETLKKILEPAGYQVFGIQDPVQALAQIAKQKPDLIFLDLVMPNANGYTVCQFLRNAPVFQNTPVIILTSRDNVVDRSRTKLVGASGFLGKPPKPDETVKMVQKYLPSPILPFPREPNSTEQLNFKTGY